MNNNSGPQLPVKEFRAGSVVAAVWRHTHSTDGRTFDVYSVTLRTRYQDRQTGEWKDAKSISHKDLPCAVLVLQKGYEYIVLRESEENSDLPAVAS